MIGSGWRRAIAAASLVVASVCGHAATIDAIEYYNASLDHYFVTALADEITKLDGGVVAGWQRTGQHFAVFDPATPVAGAAAVCRFYGLPSAGLDSHFYSASAAECASVRQRFPGVWDEETDNAFGIFLPDTATGQCPAGSVPVYRAWNARVDSNHRFTTDAATLRSMVAKGYIAEGYGPAAMPVAMCAPAGDLSGPGVTPACVVSASNSAPYVGQTILLTAACSNGATAFRWSGCESASSTCTATSSTIGSIVYSVVASNAAGAGAPANVNVAWQALPPPPKCALSRTTQTDPPVVGALAVLRATCTSNPGSFAWSGCVSTSDTCLVTETTPGAHTYTVLARNAGGTSVPAGLTLGWLSSPPPPPGACGQFPSYLLSDVGADTTRAESASYVNSPGFAWNGAWTVRFTVPTGAFTSSIGRIQGADFSGQGTMREATISTVACDFRATDSSGANGPIARATGTATTFLVSVDASQTVYPVLQPGGTYYYNLRNWAPSSQTITCPSSAGRCDAFVDVLIPH
jgi:hypothetical protein